MLKFSESITYQQTIVALASCDKLDNKRKVFNASEYRTEYEKTHGKKRKMRLTDITQFIDWLQGKCTPKTEYFIDYRNK